MRIRVGTVALGAIALAAPLAAPAAAAAHPLQGSAKVAASNHKVGSVADFTGGFAAIAGTSDLVAVDSDPATMAIRHNGIWVRHALPHRNFSPAAVVAPAADSIFIAGARYRNGHAHPAVVRWNGSKFIQEQLPHTSRYLTEYPDGDGLDSLSATSARDVWATGAAVRGPDGPVALHYNGQKWSEVRTSMCLTSISASSPRNAFGAGVPCRTPSGSRIHADIEHWDGSRWTRVFTDAKHEDIGAVATSSPRLAYAAGQSAGKAELLRYRMSASHARNVQGRDRTGSFTPVKLPAGLPANAHLRAVVTRGAAVWVAASTDPPNRYHRAFILHSRGGPPRVQQTLPSYDFWAMDADGIDVAAVGVDHGIGDRHASLFLDRLHNARWTANPEPRGAGRMVNFNDGITAVPGTTNVVAVGHTQTNGVSAMAIRRNGRWVEKVLPFGHFHPVGVVASAADNIRIAGSHYGGKYEPFPMVVRWNGSRFINERLPNTSAYDTEDDGSGYLRSISATGPDDIWASGGNLYGHQKAKPHEVSVALHYDGTKWSKRVLPEPLTKITASSPTNAFAVAVQQGPSGGVDLGVERWDGTAWTRVYSEYRGETINAVATSGPKHAYAIGSYHRRLEVMRYQPPTKSRPGGNHKAKWPTVNLPAALRERHPTRHPIAVAMKGRSVWVVVNTRRSRSGDRQSFILHSNGGPLKVQQVLNGPYVLRTLDASGRHVIASGRTANGGKPFIDQLTGSTWHVHAVT